MGRSHSSKLLPLPRHQDSYVLTVLIPNFWIRRKEWRMGQKCTLLDSWNLNDGLALVGHSIAQTKPWCAKLFKRLSLLSQLVKVVLSTAWSILARFWNASKTPHRGPYTNKFNQIKFILTYKLLLKFYCHFPKTTKNVRQPNIVVWHLGHHIKLLV